MPANIDDILCHYLQAKGDYPDLIRFLFASMDHDLLPWLRQAEEQGKKLYYDESQVDNTILDFFDADLLSIR